MDPAHKRARQVMARVAPAESRALGAMAFLAIAAILWILLPVGIGVLMGTLLAFTLHNAHRALVQRTRNPALVALSLTLATSSVVGTAIGLFAYLLVLRGVSVVSTLPAELATGGRADVLFQRIAKPLGVANLHSEDVVQRMRDALGHVASSMAGVAPQVMGAILDGFLALFFMSLTMYYVLRQWPVLARRAEHLMPINPHHTRRLMREVQRLGRMVVIGNFGTALLQGFIAGVGFWITHVPQPAFFGAVTAVASLVPAVGTLLVWVPAGALLMATGKTGWGAFELAWGALMVVGLCDYVVRPRLVGRGESMSTWLMFVSLFGGIKLFGIIGLLLGPLFVGMAVVTLRLYERTRRFRLGLS